MALDGIFLRFLINELKNDAVGCRVDKIYQPAKDEVVLLLRKKGFSAKMLMSSNTVSARIGFTNANFENPAVPPMLCMLLRKKLVGARLAAIRQPGLERVCFIDFETTDDFGDDCVLTVILEIMGRRSNFILCDDKGRIIDSIRRTDASDTVRILMPGAKYQLPPPSDKYDLLLSGPSGAASLIAESGDKKLSDALLDTMQGMCPGVCREISFEILNEKWDITSLQNTTENDIKNLDDRINTLYNNILSDEFSPCIAVAKNGKMLDFSYMPLHFYGDATISKYNTLSEVLDEGETSVELKSGGKGVMYLDGKSMDLTWKVDGDKLTLTSEKVDSTGTVQDGVIKLDSFFGMDWPMTFVKDGVTPPDMNKEGDSSAASSADASAK